ncbi:Oidioi.mRNA.OKI2018_I69.chr2.g5885.t1.cds [Oikopleura dioica]|uniref:UDP-glucose 4-epimerase n=1 Tax=Oikopleura dioica TaxID=34765 RepID=A0ABN7T1V0_OIKDI|nr:Oidioi.mRNA.OKI2018_I69.chr2.g5885.t1.cds [Oikopleura dioica]
MSRGTVLVTGGAGYIGSHTVVELLKEGYDAVVVDNMGNAVQGDNGPESLHRVEKITGKKVTFYELDVRDAEKLEKVFKDHKITAVLHFAGLKSVNESVSQPLEYYNNNISGTLILLEIMMKYGVKQFVFSSSATVYGPPEQNPVDEPHRVGFGITNPYGRTKYFIEEILRDVVIADPEWRVTMLRYFNPVGAHESGLIGEDPDGPPNNLMPYVSQVAIGRRPHLVVFGNDWETPDGTGVRDWIHVVDLAVGHIAALNKLPSNSGIKVYNLGTGRGYSVLEAVKEFEKASGKEVKYVIGPRRPGDLANVVADPRLSEKELGWKATRGLPEMCADLWRWQDQNPYGFRKKEDAK